MWQCRPSTFGNNPPHAQIEGSELVFQFEVPNERVSRTKEAFDAELSKRWIQYADEDVAIHNQRLARLLEDALALRRQQLQQATQEIQDIGIPIRKRPPVVQTESQPVREPTTRSKSPPLIKAYEYDVALSFAGEDRHLRRRGSERAAGFRD
jgi:hypothetical protein